MVERRNSDNKASLFGLYKFQISYDPPGEKSRYGPRHNNDKSDIRKISIIPTKDEILSLRQPSLPIISKNAHHFLSDCTARFLDTHFRLLREDMISPIRAGINHFLAYINKNETQVQSGIFRHEKEDIDSSLNVYTNLRFVSCASCDNNIFCEVAFKPPKMNSEKSNKQDFKYKELKRGSLICVIWKRDCLKYELYFGEVTKSNESSLNNEEAIVNICFVDHSIYQIACDDIEKGMEYPDRPRRFMVETPSVYFGAYKHILMTLQEMYPYRVPFEQYIMSPSATQVATPTYTRTSEFKFDLSILLKNPGDSLFLDVQCLYSQENAIKKLSTQNVSTLSRPQAYALVNALCSEFSLIQGPPGTGKTHVGVEIIRVLLNASIFPILVMSFTNHALDQFLENLIDKNITSIIRLGSRSKSERIKNLEKPEDPINVQILGATTSGVAKYRSLILGVAPQVILVEEAGEILEAHVISSLCPSMQHIILIGDHRQLRPHISTKILSMDSQIGKAFKLDRSLFERLINEGMVPSQITEQRRMRPEIADLIRPIYPALTDEINTTKYPKVRGVQHNLFFFDHRNPEEVESNEFEVEFLVALVRHLVRNGYDQPNDIAVLTPYLNQLNKIKDALKGQFINIKVKTVDDFQGEEAIIVIISLVRNVTFHNRTTIGFLRSQNRINVLLSRAKHGMFLLGNEKLMSNESDMWRNIINLMKE
ncbi:22327_t:CDS:10, partial [Racocetra persica]